MAEKKKGNSKKLFIIGGIVVAIIVVLILILTNCLPKGKSTDEVYDDVASYRLLATDYNNKSSEFTTKVAGNANTSYYETELKDMNKLIPAMETVSEYYDDYFAIANGGMKGRNAGAIHGNLESIKNIKNELTEILANSQSISATGSTYLQNAVVELRGAFVKLVDNYKSLFNLSNQVYHDSLGSCIVVNPASRVTLNIIDDFMAVIVNEYKALCEKDVAGSNKEVYNFNSLHAKISALSRFVYANLGTADSIVATGINQYYSSGLTDYDKVDALPAQLGEANYQNVISTIAYSGLTLVCTYTAKDGVNVDNSSLLILKSFLGG